MTGYLKYIINSQALTVDPANQQTDPESRARTGPFHRRLIRAYINKVHERRTPYRRHCGADLLRRTLN